MRERKRQDGGGDGGGDDALERARPTGPTGLGRALGLRNVLSAVLADRAPAPITLGAFELERRVGGGGMGDVFRARRRSDERPFAVKILRARDDDARRRFDREARVLETLTHETIVGFEAHGQTDEGAPWIAMDWIDGDDLQHRLARGPLMPNAAVDLALELARGLSEAHGAGIVHRDLKPSNVMLAAGNTSRPRLIDFGIARATDTNPMATRLTKTGFVVGTPAYMAPEQVHGRFDTRTDIYGLGALLFECLTGRPPFSGRDAGALLLAVLAETPPSVRSTHPDVPRELDALIASMLAKSPDDRPPSMATLAEELALLERTAITQRAAGGVSLDERISPALVPLEEGPTITAPAPFLGRRRELALVTAALEDIEEQGAPGIIAVTGERGSGRTRLLEEAIATLAPDRFEVRRVRPERGERMRPLRTLERLLGDVSTAEGTAPTFASGLRRAHDRDDDPRVAADRMALAFRDWLDARGGDGRIWVFCIDDVEGADRASLRFLGDALARASAPPFAVLVSGTEPPESLLERTALWRRTSVPLPPLGARICRALIAHWQGSAPETEGTTGLPGRIEEAVKGRGTRGASAASALDRVAALAPEPRRALRAASMAGDIVSLPLMVVLLDLDLPRVRALLDALVADGFLIEVEARRAREPDAREYRFASAYYRHAALDRCTEADLQRGHLLIARWKQARPAFSPDEVAAHFDAAARPRDAQRAWLDAAGRALVAGLEDVVETCLARAATETPDTPAEVRCEAQGIRAELAMWRGDLACSEAAASDALEDTSVERDPGAWYRIASLAITAAGQRGDNDRVGTIASLVVDAPPTEHPGRIEAIGRAASQLAAVQHPLLSRLEGALRTHRPGALPARARAWWWRGQLLQSMARDFGEGERAAFEAHRAHLEARDHRAAALLSVFLADASVQLGEWSLAEERYDAAESAIERLNAPYLMSWQRFSRCKLMVEVAEWGETQRALRSVLDDPRMSARIRDGAHIYLGIAALRAGDTASAEASAREVLERESAHEIHMGALALVLRAAYARERLDEATAETWRALDDARAGATHVIQFYNLIALGHLEGLLLLGRDADAIASRQASRRAFEARMSSLEDPARRHRLMFEPHLNRQLFVHEGGENGEGERGGPASGRAAP